jgi:iron complex outermembrane receptor protein
VVAGVADPGARAARLSSIGVAMAKTSSLSTRQTLMLFTACGLVASLVPAATVLAQTATTAQQAAQAAPQAAAGKSSGTSKRPQRRSANVQLAQATAPAASSTSSAIESITVRAQRQILKEKNSPSAVTELGAAAIASTGIAGSTATLLRQAPSIYVYSQGLGDNAPELTVRGLRGLEIATTLDGIPTQDLEAPGSFYLANNLGAVFTLNQISDVSIYPGVAYPDKNTFGTIGGTIAYNSKRPTNDYYFDVTGSVGSFGTYKEGFELNSGRIDSPLGTGDNAAKLLLNYENLQTQGFIDGTPNRENEMEFAFDKPYDDGLSKFQATVIYNQADGLIENEPVPVPYLQKYGQFSNYPTNLDFAQERNDYITGILKDDTYVNDYLSVGLTGFYIHNDQQLETYGNINEFAPGGVNTPLTVGGSTPFINNPAGFGEGGLYGPAVPPPLGIYGGGYGGYFYGKGNHYNPAIYYNNPKACPATVIANFGGVPGDTPCGLNDETQGQSSDTYGFQPRATISLPQYFGIDNTIKIGGLFAKETTPDPYTYLGAFPQSVGPENNAAVRTGGTQRTIYQGYIQDKIDLIDGTLHITPGATLEGTYSSFVGSEVFRSPLAPYSGPNGYANGGTLIDRYGYYKSKKWDREALPFFNVSYDFDKILPRLKGLSVYASTGSSALFAPVTDFSPSTVSLANPQGAPPPYASIVHLYEGGIKYNTPTVLLSADYFYQKVDRDFGFYSSQTGTNFGATVYSSDGQREFKGFEASAVWKVTPELQLFANGSHLLAKYLTTGLDFDTVAEDQYGVSIKGSPISGIPDWLSTFGAEYTKSSTFIDTDKVDIRLTGQYTGHQYTTCDLTLSDPSCGTVYIAGVKGVDYSGGLHSDAVFDTFTGATTTQRNGGGINPFVVFNLDANYSLPTPQLGVIKKITFDLNVQNLFNEFYYQYFYRQVSPSSCSVTAKNPTGNPYGCTPQFSDAIPGEPFSVFFTVTARF